MLSTLLEVLACVLIVAGVAVMAGAGPALTVAGVLVLALSWMAGGDV